MEFHNRFPDENDYIEILKNFPLYGERGWKKQDLKDCTLGYFGEATSGENGMRTLGNYIFITSLLASDAAFESVRNGVSQTVLLAKTRSAIAYMTRSHLTGDIACTDGQKWGGHWQSAWWTAKMAMGAKLVWKQLHPSERENVERVIVFEASCHLERVFPTGLNEDTKAEENAWDAEVLAMAISLFPENQQCDQWRRKLIELNYNTLSAPQDLTSNHVEYGKPIREHVYTANTHSDHTLENHGACHFCYVASPLVSIAWSYYALSSQGEAIPDSLFHHVDDLWSWAKSTFLESRFAYIGGKDWARYTYGLYFIVPALVAIQAKYGDTDARAIEIERVKTLAQEQLMNNDGSFFGQRITRNEFFGQNAKYETDCYACLGLAYLLHKQLSTDKTATNLLDLNQNLSRQHVSPESGTCFVRTPKLFASFSWRTLTQPDPIALFIPAGMDNAAEWRHHNLLGEVIVPGIQNTVGVRSMKKLNGGFYVKGIVSIRGKYKELLAHNVFYQVIPELDCAIVESKYISKGKNIILSKEGLSFAIVNDCFNGFTRNYSGDKQSEVVKFDSSQGTEKKGKFRCFLNKISRKLDLNTANLSMGERWINIDEKIGVIQLLENKSCFNLRQEYGRNTPNRCLHYDLLTNPKREFLLRYSKPGEVVLHTRFLLLAGNADDTEEFSNNCDKYKKAVF
ncbi:MAG: hypothetical protein AAGD25_35140 [Cyanobacteria bacterium P01_F01_bin.150]